MIRHKSAARETLTSKTGLAAIGTIIASLAAVYTGPYASLVQVAPEIVTSILALTLRHAIAKKP